MNSLGSVESSPRPHMHITRKWTHILSYPAVCVWYVPVSCVCRLNIVATPHIASTLSLHQSLSQDCRNTAVFIETMLRQLFSVSTVVATTESFSQSSSNSSTKKCCFDSSFLMVSTCCCRATVSSTKCWRDRCWLNKNLFDYGRHTQKRDCVS